MLCWEERERSAASGLSLYQTNLQKQGKGYKHLHLYSLLPENTIKLGRFIVDTVYNMDFAVQEIVKHMNEDAVLNLQLLHTVSHSSRKIPATFKVLFI
jgi:hypothetical protein